MKNLLRILRIAVSKRGLFIPVLFFAVEFCVAIILNWQLFGEKYEKIGDNQTAEVYIHNPLIVIKAVHSDRLTHPYGKLTSASDMPMFKFYSQGKVFTALAFLASLLCSYIGITISVLWINNYFRNKNRNVNWWLWPAGCMGAHVILFLLANSTLSNIFLK